MRAEKNLLLLAVVGIALLGAGVLEAQQTMLLRYRPAVGRTLRTISWHDIAMTIGDLPAGGAAMGGDTLRLDIEILQSVTERVLESRGDRYMVQRSIDSTRGRTRAMSGSWRDVELADSGGPPAARLVVTERLQVEDFTLTRGDSASQSLEWLRNPAGTFELTFPEEPVAVGGSWNTEIVVPLTAGGMAVDEPGANLAAGAEMVARVAVTLDSLVARGTDTLAYVQMRGNFLPITVSEAAEVAEGRAAISGAFAGSLIWSTGWDAWVSGAARTRLTVRVELGGTDETVASGFAMRLVQDTQFQVRP